MARVAEEVFLRYQDSRSNKGFVSRLMEEEDGTWTHFTAWGAVGRTFQEGTKYGLTEEKARKAHTSKVKDKMTGDTPYNECEPEVLGFARSTGAEIISQAVQVVQQERVWSPMLFSPIPTSRAKQLVQDPAYFAQKKEDGVRMRLYAGEDGLVRACNRKGQELPVPQVTAELGRALFAQIGVFDLDGESIGNNAFHAFDVLHIDPSAPAIERVTCLLDLARSFPGGIILTPTALTTDAKQDLLSRAVEEGWEGLMFKRRDTPYSAGRSPRDNKFKMWQEVTVALTEVNRTGKLEHGSARMIWLDPRDQQWKTVGNVSSGFKSGDLAEIAACVTRGGPVLADVRYLYFSEAALYQPCFRRVRRDLTPQDLGHQELVGRDGQRVVL